MMKKYHMTIVFSNGNYSNVTHLKAENKLGAINKMLEFDSEERKEQIVSITILEVK